MKNLATLVMAIYNVGMDKQKSRIVPKVICSGITALISLGITIRILAGSWIWTGTQYLFMSIQKRMAILWADQSGNWANMLTGVRFSLFEALKSNLIEKDEFAQFLSSLATHGIGEKFFQIFVLLLCTTALLSVLVVLFRSSKNFILSLIILVYLNHNKRLKMKQRTRKSTYTTREENNIKVVPSKNRLG